ncbi:MAG: protein translocase subunit SecF, partial [Deltaproteobacteria bacterium]|nr:protein translocase subunit SecF [Deltaproteobacteria bacterium]
MQIIKPGINVNFMGKRYIAFALSAVLLLTGLVAYIVRGGLNYGVDFSGGLMVQIKMAEPKDVSDIRKVLESVNLQESTIQSLGKADDAVYLVRSGKLEGINSGTLNSDITNALKAHFGEDSILEVGR